jgi:hypothetical protein
MIGNFRPELLPKLRQYHNIFSLAHAACKRPDIATTAREKAVLVIRLLCFPTMSICRNCIRRSLRHLSQPRIISPVHQSIAIAGPTTAQRNYATPVNPLAELEDEASVNKAKVERAARKHLRYMDDPYNFSMAVKELLADGDAHKFDVALEVVRKGSNGRQVEVAWNHLIEREIEKDNLEGGVKLYNEVSQYSLKSPLQPRYLCCCCR